MYSFEKRSTIINVLFWKTLYNDQCTVLKNALRWSMLFLKNALQWSLYCFEKRFTMINVLFEKRFTMIIVLFWKKRTTMINVLFWKNALQWSLYCLEKNVLQWSMYFFLTLYNDRRSTIDQCSVFEKPSAMINVLFLKNPPQWSMYCFEKRFTMINVQFWKTLYNNQCSVLKNAL